MAEVRFPISKTIATLGPVGFWKAPGTWATACTLPVAAVISLLELGAVAHALLLCVIVLLAVFCVQVALVHFDCHDPSEIVIDEFVGCLITFYGMPFSLPIFIVGFVCFRFFDITKSCGINYVQNIPGAWGIVLDDVAAALITNVILHVLLSKNIL